MSAYVVNVCVFFVGMGVFRGMRTVITWPAVSMPIERGVTSTKTTSWIFYDYEPVNIAAYTAAP